MALTLCHTEVLHERSAASAAHCVTNGEITVSTEERKARLGDQQLDLATKADLARLENKMLYAAIAIILAVFVSPEVKSLLSLVLAG